MSNEAPKFRDELAEKLNQAPKGERVDILGQAKQTQEYTESRAERTELAKNRGKVFKVLDSFVEEYKNDRFDETFSERPWHSFSLEFLDGDDAYHMVATLKERLKKAIKLEVNPTPPGVLRFQVFSQFPYYLADDRGYISMDGWAVIGISDYDGKPHLQIDVDKSHGKSEYGGWPHGADYKKKVGLAVDSVNQIVKDKPDFAESVRRFEEFTPQVKAILMSEAGKIYEEFILEYKKLVLRQIEGSNETLSQRETLKKFKSYGIEKTGQIKTLLSLVPVELRAQLFPFRDLTVEELEKKIEKDTQAGVALDARRFNFHRFVEFFAFKCLYGRSSAQVRWDIERLIESNRKEIFPIIGEVYCSSDGEDNRYSIVFGDGLENANGSHEYHDEESGEVLEEVGADMEESDYTSKIAPGRSFEQDEVLVSRIADSLRKRYPLLKFKKDFRESGSFHEIFRYFDFWIDGFSLEEIAQKEGLKDSKIVLDEIFEIIRTLVKEELDSR